MSIRFAVDPMQPDDWAEVRAIFTEGLVTGLAAFMRTPPLWTAWDAGHLPVGRLVARRDAEILGWAALSTVADT